MFGKAFRWLTNGFLKIFGDIKVFKWPLFLLYDPGSYRVKGEDVREVIELVQPGDILVRGYNNYLDGFFIPGYFSHAGVFLGKVEPDDKEFLKAPKGHEMFRTGAQVVAHAMAEGVFMEDVINFCRCDRMAILRLPKTIVRNYEARIDEDKMKTFNEAEKKIAADLDAGKNIALNDIFATFFQLALSKVGEKYDFQFNFSNYNDLSCTEFAFFIMKSLEAFHGLSPKKKRFLIFAKEVLTPDAFVESPLELVWQSRSVDQHKIGKLRIAAKD